MAGGGRGGEHHWATRQAFARLRHDRRRIRAAEQSPGRIHIDHGDGTIGSGQGEGTGVDLSKQKPKEACDGGGKPQGIVIMSIFKLSSSFHKTGASRESTG